MLFRGRRVAWLARGSVRHAPEIPRSVPIPIPGAREAPDVAQTEMSKKEQKNCCFVYFKLDRTRGAVRPLGGYLGRGLKNHKNHQKVRKKTCPGERPHSCLKEAS